jgi:hypothetical protein
MIEAHMKRIIDGVTYSTDTATLIAQAERVDDYAGSRPEERSTFRLYQTRGGAFFVHTRMETQRKNLREEWLPITRDEFEPLSRDQAQSWILEGDVELLNDVFGEPPEASGEPAAGATLYIRVPASLKDRLEVLARDENVSLNTWTIRCVERCANIEDVGDCLGGIISTGMCLTSEPGPGAYSEATVREMVEHMREEAEAAARMLGWRSKNEIERLAANVAGTSHYRVFKPYED